MDTDKIFESKTFKIIIFSLAGLTILVFIFGLGVDVGIRHAEFSFNWAESYHTNFGGPQGAILGNMMVQDFTDSNGVYGQILKIEPSVNSDQISILTIKGNDNIEKKVTTDKKTTIVFQKKNIKADELKTDDNVIVIGNPDSKGQIHAELIRVMPPVPISDIDDSPLIPGPKE